MSPTSDPPRVPDPSAIDWQPVRLVGLDVRLLDDPLSRPVQTSFGTMRSRPGLLVRLRDQDGREGLGEVWCNFPTGGARYRATLLAEYAAPALAGQTFTRPQDLQAALRERLTVLALQCADRGAIEQMLAGLDQAAWDLFCKVLGQPFWRLMGGKPSVAVYASGIGPHEVASTVERQRAQGYRWFKLKLGFGDAADEAGVEAALGVLPQGGRLAVDVNQGWSQDQARAWLPRLAALGIVWCEEPVRADTSWPAWRALADCAPSLRLAAGENLLGLESFLNAMTLGGLRVLQPDLGKWGGISGNLELAAGWPGGDTWLCPHWLAGGVGLMASLQFKAVVGGDGPVEVDANPNRQRSDAFRQALQVVDGCIELPQTPGIVPPLSDWLADPDQWIGHGH